VGPGGFGLPVWAPAPGLAGLSSRFGAPAPAGPVLSALEGPFGAAFAGVVPGPLSAVLPSGFGLLLAKLFAGVLPGPFERPPPGDVPAALAGGAAPLARTTPLPENSPGFEVAAIAGAP
jgi:hypothetical protein